MEYHKKNGIKADLTEEGIQGAIEGSEFTGSPHGPKPGSFVTHKVFRPSPRLVAKPPVGAIVLFDEKNLDQWELLERFSEYRNTELMLSSRTAV